MLNPKKYTWHNGSAVSHIVPVFHILCYTIASSRWVPVFHILCYTIAASSIMLIFIVAIVPVVNVVKINAKQRC